MALNGFGIPDRIPVERTAPMARFRRSRRAIARVRQAIAPRVTVIRERAPVVIRSAGRRVGRFSRAFAGSRAGKESKDLLGALVESGAAMGAGALSGASEGLVTTDGERKALPWVRRGISVGLNLVAEKWGGRGSKLVRAVANGVAGADGALSVQRRAGVVSAKK